MPLPSLPLPVTVAPGDPGHTTLHNNVNSVGNYLVSDSQAQNTVLAAPSGSAGAAVFRLLTAADIPTLTLSKISDAGTMAAQNANAVAITGGSAALTAQVSSTLSDVNVDTSPILLLLKHLSSSPPIAQFGSQIQYQGQDNGGTNRQMGAIVSDWLDATPSTRKAELLFDVWDNTGVHSPLSIQPDQLALNDGINLNFGSSIGTIIANGVNQKFAFHGAIPVIRQTGGGALTNNVTVGGTTGTIADFTSLTIYATDAAAIRNDIYQLARMVGIINAALRTYGLLS